jgi:hypothetical protein
LWAARLNDVMLVTTSFDGDQEISIKEGDAGVICEGQPLLFYLGRYARLAGTVGVTSNLERQAFEHEGSF